MKRRGCGINVIIEGLVVNRQGVITESPANQVQNDIKFFIKERKVSGTEKKMFYNLLTSLYKLCNDAGPYTLVSGRFDFLKGDFDDSDSYDNPDANPSLYEYSYNIKFLADVDIDSLYKSIYNEFKSQKSNYKTLDIDSFAITAEFSSKSGEGLYLAVQKGSSGFRSIRVSIGYQTFALESKTGVCGTEIGLPIDKENCESTGIGGISTPTGGFTDSKELEKKKKKKLIPVEEAEKMKESDEEKDVEVEPEEGEEGVEPEEKPEKENKSKKKSSDKKEKDNGIELEDIDRLTCPECNSPNVNSDGEVIMCSDCGYTWDLKKKETVQKDRMLPQKDDVSVSDYQKHNGQLQDTNDVECIETQQNVDRRNM